ncbi:MarR family winged helix-turn-helix transcriptional regulator [Pelagibacterium xiamenense]|uniref:MarR family winged helix-turn-helix transcriptional regulator n=1 Tax=Pelagibacterium xiamenense TaxID=2901140 RepID=UPI001E2CA36A|nr:MarR family transcriptional regulator [Pelagibacterium xiamenense]MCD7060291.1 MarR family transcriptional regulator [Pelagibacterium xiamenense]
MPASKINVNKADINSAIHDFPEMPIDIMGLFFFAYRDFVRDADALLETKGFGRAHHRVIYFVNLRPGMTVAELLDILRITKQSLARVLRQLIDSGYIIQRHGDTDRRQRLLFPTDQGREFFETLSATQARRIDGALAALPPSARECVARFFVEMTEKGDKDMLTTLRLTEQIP